jgi:hypothetical protein
MKRMVVLLLALLLLLSLSSQGSLGVAFGLPDSASVTSLTSLPQYDDGNFVFPSLLPLPDRFQKWCGLWQVQPVLVGGQPTLKIITYCHIGGSGGISQ